MVRLVAIACRNFGWFGFIKKVPDPYSEYIIRGSEFRANRVPRFLERVHQFEAPGITETIAYSSAQTVTVGIALVEIFVQYNKKFSIKHTIPKVISGKHVWFIEWNERFKTNPAPGTAGPSICFGIQQVAIFEANQNTGEDPSIGCKVKASADRRTYFAGAQGVILYGAGNQYGALKIKVLAK